MSVSLSRLQTFYDGMEPIALLRAMITHEFPDRIAVSTSFGADSAILLHLVAQADKGVPVLFLETGKHFRETLQYARDLSEFLGLTNVQYLTPDAGKLQNIDKNDDLWNHQPNRCCWLRKVEPLKKALEDQKIEALITGRKRYQTADRAQMQAIDIDAENRFRINPLAFWGREDLAAYRKRHGLPPHPLAGKGYLSIGCAPCTRAVEDGQNERAGRWAHTLEDGLQKTECGIHLPLNQTPDWSV